MTETLDIELARFFRGAFFAGVYASESFELAIDLDDYAYERYL